MRTKIEVFAAEKTPLYLPLFVAAHMAKLWRNYRISIHTPAEKDIDGDAWAIDELKKATANNGGAKDSLYFAICDPTKLDDPDVPGSFAIVCSLISKAAFWVIGKQEHGETHQANNPCCIYTYPVGMSANAIADSIWCADRASGSISVSPVNVDHELCHLLVASKENKVAKALTANILSAVRFTKDHHKEKLDILDTLAKNPRFQEYFLTGVIGVRDQIEVKEAKHFLRHMYESMELVSKRPNYAARVLARTFEVSFTEALDVVGRLNVVDIYSRFVPEQPSWRLALSIKYQASGNALNDQSLDDKANEFKKYMSTRSAEECTKHSGIKWRFWLLYASIEGHLKDRDLDVSNRGEIIAAMVASVRWLLVDAIAVGIVGLLLTIGWEHYRDEHSTKHVVDATGSSVTPVGTKAKIASDSATQK